MATSTERQHEVLSDLFNDKCYRSILMAEREGVKPWHLTRRRQTVRGAPDKSYHNARGQIWSAREAAGRLGLESDVVEQPHGNIMAPSTWGNFMNCAITWEDHQVIHHSPPPPETTVFVKVVPLHLEAEAWKDLRRTAAGVLSRT